MSVLSWGYQIDAAVECSWKDAKETYALMRITLNNGESARVLGILHDKPGFAVSVFLSFFSYPQFNLSLLGKEVAPNSPTQTFLVIGVDLRSFLQLGNQLVDGLLILLCVEVHDECVDHICGCGCWIIGWIERDRAVVFVCVS
jgi:hypothetical protein